MTSYFQDGGHDVIFLQWCSRVHLVRVQWVRVRVHLVRVRVQASRSDRVSKSCVSEVTVSEIKQHVLVPIHWIPVTDETQIINSKSYSAESNSWTPRVQPSPGVRVRVQWVRVRVLKISTRVGLEYTAGLEYYITVFLSFYTAKHAWKSQYWRATNMTALAEAEAALAIDKVGPRPCHFCSGPTKPKK